MRLERTPDKREVTGSTPVRPTVIFCAKPIGQSVLMMEIGKRSNAIDWIMRGISSVGRASGLQPEGHRFEPGILHKTM
jgi:hypothetical protein